MPYTKISIFILFILIVLLLADFTFAQRELEVPLPQLGTTKLPFLPDYVKYIFNFAVGIAGLIAFVMIIIGGIRYLTSVGNPSAMSDANDQIFSGIIGLIVILGSWLILTTVNPQLIIIKAEREATPAVEEIEGVYLCRDSEAKDCEIFTQSAGTIGELNNNVQSIKFKNSKEFKYGLVLHEDKYYKGKCAICLNNGCSDGYNNISHVNGVSSIHIFVQANSSPGEGVSLYEKEEYNANCKPGECSRWPSVGGHKIAKEPSLNQVGKSIKIDESGQYLAALFEETHYNGECEIFTHSDPGLASNPIGICNGPNWWDIRNYGCFTSFIVLPIK